MKRLGEILPKVRKLLTGILPRQGGSFAVGDLPPPVGLLLAGALAPGGLRLLVFGSPLLADRALIDAQALLPGVTLLPLVPNDEEGSAASGERLAQIRDILAAKEGLILTSIHALLQPIPEPKALAASCFTLSTGTEHPFDTLAETLTALGYERADLVVEPLTFAIRGGIVDLWVAGMENPVRIEFFGDEVERLRRFDPTTQRSVDALESLTIGPTPKMPLGAVQLLSQLTSVTSVVMDWPTIESGLTQLHQVSAKESNAAWFARTLEALGPVCWSGEPLRGGLPSVALVARPIEGVRELLGEGGARHPEAFGHVRATLLGQLNERAKKHETILLCAPSAGGAELLRHELGAESKVHIVREGLSEGFDLANLKITVVAQSDLYPTRRVGTPLRARKSPLGARLEYAFDVEPGELVVHLEHGIGRFLGLTEIELAGRRTEVFTLEYAHGAKLHVPTTHAHLLSRYIGPNQKNVKLHALDGKRWTNERAAAQQGIEDLAVGLLETQARRRVLPGFAFRVDDPWIAEFEALFPWEETRDQAKVIEEIKHDMASPMAMDRLLCGDAGYGKTEVAMRAAFICVANHKQVAVLAPTTVLAEQHYATFCERMGPFPVRIEVLSRFRTPAERAKTRLAAQKGEVDILIGTHALLTENIPFHDLGLLIIDEEQRFGVTHKEQLKRLRAVVDVLTMSATPIPRTLYLSLTGARDLSLIQTPPQNRVAVETKVMVDRDDLVAAAIRRELARGGQIFYLYNRVHTMQRLYDRLRRIVPEASVVMAHGQMHTEELASAMRTFEQGHADILLSTTIIESGIDIPRANTILIDRADRFGLADLYQLRGRVGRSAVKGIACLLLPSEGIIESDARERLLALKRHNGLGAGYRIALRDLELRGSGNLLGAAQSGHIAAIGFGLYCQLLRRTVARLKGEAIPTLVDTEIDLDFIESSPGATGEAAACIPYAYVEDEAQRMNLYRRLAEAARSQEVDALAKELEDRYGPLPEEVQRALSLAHLRILAAQRGLARVEVREGKLTLVAKRTQAPLRAYHGSPLTGTTPDQRLATLKRHIKRLPSP